MKGFRTVILALMLALGAVSAQADLVLRQATASQAVQVGPFVDTAGAVVPGLTIANTDVRLSKNGAAAVTKNSGGCTYDINGMYLCTFDATDSNTAGRLQVSIVETGALPVYHEFQVTAPAVYDACCTGTSAPLTATDVWTIPGTRTTTGGTITTVTGTVGSVTGAVGSVTGNIGGNVNGSVASVVNPVTVGTNNDKTGYALSTAGNEAVLNTVVEDMGNISARCMLALLGAVLNGDYTTAGNTTTFRDNTGVETRMTSTQTTTSRTVTITCPTY